MKYRLRIDIAYPDTTNPQTLWARTEALKHDAVIINPGQDFEERGYIRLEECYHDEDPIGSCVLIDNWKVPEP